ncbi:MAG TPA: hypothetical protein VIL85_27130 [Thermomicrobiales bacterium]
MHRFLRLAAITLIVAGFGTAPVSATVTAATAERCFPETGFCVTGRFLAYWEANGGLARNGYPISGERAEILEDGQAYRVQYFERVRLEYHAENAPPNDVLLGHFGRRVARAQFSGHGDVGAFWRALAPVPASPGAAYFAETGHNLAGAFLTFWQANGGLAQLGYPLTEERREVLEDGREYTVQYFERARLERHPENAAPYDVLLGQFGRRLEREATLLAGAGSFGRLYFADRELRDRLGPPLAAATPMPGAAQEFERGRMLWLGGLRAVGGNPAIYVLVGGPDGGTLYPWAYVDLHRLAWPDTWREGEAPGGGPGPAPGLYEPRRGFGKLWRLGYGVLQPGYPAAEGVIREQLGHALTAEETG